MVLCKKKLKKWHKSVDKKKNIKYNLFRNTICYKIIQKKEVKIFMRKKGQVEPMKNISIRIKDETMENVSKIAEIKRRDKTEMIRIIIEDYTKNFEDILSKKSNISQN